MEEVAQIINAIILIGAFALFTIDAITYLLKRETEDAVGAILWLMVLMVFK